MMRSRNWRQHLHSQLSKAQKEAVMHKDGPMMVLAGPGSGKTLVITKRIQYLISHYQIPPQRILVITFTRAAANEMKERFWRLAGETLPVSFGTFHSVFFTILKYAYHYSADNILPEHKKYDFIREIITDHELEIDDEADFMRQIIQEISLVKGQMIPLAYYHSGCCGDEVFKEIYRAYEEKLHENRWIDFDDILVYTYELLKEREDIRKAWQQKFPYILIDEFQDINKIQYEIVKMLAGETKNLFIVGDDDQSIYKFRGARPELMLNFPKDFENTRQVILNRNYRCGEEIVQVAEDIISYNTKRFEKKMQAREDATSMVEVRTFKDHYEENKHIIYTIKEEMAKKTCRSVPRRRRPERPQGGLCRAGHARRDDRESLRACAPHCRHQERRLRPQACDRAHRPEGGWPGDQVRRWPADPAHARRHSRLRPLRGLAQYGRGDLYARLSGRGEDRDGKLRDQHAACLA